MICFWFKSIDIGNDDIIFADLTAVALADELPPELEAYTETFPFCLPTATVTAIVPWPAVIVQSEGTDQVYDVALATAAILYICLDDSFGYGSPSISTGALGGGITFVLVNDISSMCTTSPPQP